jgi:hypothetical protein
MSIKTKKYKNVMVYSSIFPLFYDISSSKNFNNFNSQHINFTSKKVINKTYFLESNNSFEDYTFESSSFEDKHPQWREVFLPESSIGENALDKNIFQSLNPNFIESNIPFYLSNKILFLIISLIIIIFLLGIGIIILAANIIKKTYKATKYSVNNIINKFKKSNSSLPPISSNNNDNSANGDDGDGDKNNNPSSKEPNIDYDSISLFIELLTRLIKLLKFTSRVVRTNGGYHPIHNMDFTIELSLDSLIKLEKFINEEYIQNAMDKSNLNISETEASDPRNLNARKFLNMYFSYFINVVEDEFFLQRQDPLYNDEIPPMPTLKNYPNKMGMYGVLTWLGEDNIIEKMNFIIKRLEDVVRILREL